MSNSDVDEDSKEKWEKWSNRMGKGYLENESYFKAKWGCLAGMAFALS